jgi:hypothetical protein
MEYISAGLLRYPVRSVDLRQLHSASIAVYRPQARFFDGVSDGKPGMAGKKPIYYRYLVRRAKARSFSGCEPRPAMFAPAGSNRSSRGGNETAEAFGVEGPERDLANMQAVT